MDASPSALLQGLGLLAAGAAAVEGEGQTGTTWAPLSLLVVGMAGAAAGGQAGGMKGKGGMPQQAPKGIGKADAAEAVGEAEGTAPGCR